MIENQDPLCTSVFLHQLLDFLIIFSLNGLLIDELPLLASVLHELKARRVERDGVLLATDIMNDYTYGFHSDVGLWKPVWWRAVCEIVWKFPI